MENTTVATVEEQKRIEANKIALIKKTVARDATNDELSLFLYQAKRTGLDPLTRQIYFVKRHTKNGAVATIQTSIDGFRVIAERSGLYAGQDEPEFLEGDSHPIKCTVRVYKFTATGVRYCASVGVAYWDEYKPDRGDSMWIKMPHTMLSKVAEALALRKAFPQDLSGLYTAEEMDQSNPNQNKQTENGTPLVGEITNLPSAEFVQATASTATNYDEMDDFGAINSKKEESHEMTRSEVLQSIEEMFGDTAAKPEK